MGFWHVKFCKNLFKACTMILKFIVACHVSTIPKSPPKIIRENTYTGFWESQFFFISVWSELLDCHVATLFAMTANRQCKRQKCHVITSGSEVIQCIVDAVNQRFTTSYQLHLKTLSLTLFPWRGNNSSNLVIRVFLFRFCFFFLHWNQKEKVNNCMDQRSNTDLLF